jgi:putative transposase
MSRQAPDEYYHIYNRGTQKQPIFTSDADRLRFLFLLLTMQGAESISNMSRVVRASVQHSMLNISPELSAQVAKHRSVELVAFCMMPNHFHLIMRELEEGGVSKYMQRLQNAYTKYFNTRYGKSGHLMQGPYKSKHISDDRYLMHLSAYIHKNPEEISMRKGRLDEYMWSSFKDCIVANRFPSLLSVDILTNRDQSSKHSVSSYKSFVASSSAKELREELGEM